MNNLYQDYIRNKMENIRTYIEIGKGMGLTGNELAAFVDKRESLAREAEKEKQAIEREERARERDERAKEREEKKREKELAQQEKQTLLKLELADKEIELAKLNAWKADPKAKTIEPKVKIPKLPPFSDGKDNMDSYLKRFERFATNAKWPKEEWATNLSTLLQGKALDVYSRLSSAEALDYDKLCDALLKRYQLTEEGFRQKFRTSKQEVGETAGQFVVRLTNYLTRWMELGRVSATYEGLKDLILREQFLTVSNRDLVLFLKERKIKSIKEMADLAEQYNEAHSVNGTTFRESIPNRTDSNSDFLTKNNSKYTNLDDNQQPRVFKERSCYGCGKKDHFIKSCPVRNFTSQISHTKVASLEVKENQKQMKQKVEPDDKSHESMDEEEITVATCMVLKPPCSVNSVVTPQIEPENNVKKRNQISHDSGHIANKSEGSMPVMEGFVGERKVLVLRDSGCNSAIVRESLVKHGEFTGNNVSCVLVDGTKRTLPVAQITVSNPFVVGKIEALCMKNPVFDLVLGNIQKVRPSDNPNMEWQFDVNIRGKQSGKIDFEIEPKSCDVKSRVQKQRHKTRKSLVLPCCVQNVNKNEDINRQNVCKNEDINRQNTYKTHSDQRLKARSDGLLECTNSYTIQYMSKGADNRGGNFCRQNENLKEATVG